MPARAKVVKYEGDGEETYRMVKTEDARLKTKPAGAKVDKYEGDSDPDALRARLKTKYEDEEQRLVTAIEAAQIIAGRYEAYLAAAATAERGRDRSRTRSRSSRRIRRSPRRSRSSHRRGLRNRRRSRAPTPTEMIAFPYIGGA